MKRSRIILLAFAAVFCMSAVAAASAMATETLTVTNEAGAEANTTFTGKTTSKVFVLKAKGGDSIECTGLTSSGTVKASVGESTFKFTSCEASVGGKCKTTGASAGEIVTPALTVHLVYASSAKTSILLLVSILPKGTAVIAIKCGEVPVEVRGSFLIPVGTSQELSFKTAYTFTAAQTGGVQAPVKFYNNTTEKEEENTLEASFAKGAFEQAGESASQEVTFAEKVKLG